jgi:ATP phosphoribosyltransferase
MIHLLTRTLAFTESGETMRAAGLHPIATVISTEAVLITSKKSIAEGPKASFAPLIRLIISRLAGVVASRKFVLLVYNIPREKLAKAILITPGRRSPTVSSLEETDWVAVNAMVERAEVAQVMDQLQEIGAVDLLVTKLENCRV